MRVICIFLLVVISVVTLAEEARDRPPVHQAAIAAREKIRLQLLKNPDYIDDDDSSDEDSSDEDVILQDEEGSEEEDDSEDESEERSSENLVKRSAPSPFQPRPAGHNSGYVVPPRPGNYRPGGFVRPVTIPARVTLRPRPNPGNNKRRGNYNGGRNEVDPLNY